MIQEQLLRMYADRGYTARTGSSLAGHGDIMAELTTLWADGRRVEAGWAPSLSELSVLQLLVEIWAPERVFCIGAGFGWTPLALRLLLPRAFLTATDPGAEGPDALAGIRLANAMLAAAGGGEVIHGRSPEAVPPAVENLLEGRINLAVINTRDAAQQARDIAAVQPYLERDHVVLCHGVRFSNALDGFNEIAQAYPGRAALLDRTTSGIGLLWSPSLAHRMQRLAFVFSQPDVKV